jgi:hypothetical protein
MRGSQWDSETAEFQRSKAETPDEEKEPKAVD